MIPSEHINWFDENVHWFENLPLSSLGNDVPNCPGWTVEKVITHLTFGLGLAYPYAIATPADADDDQPWAKVPWPLTLPTGKQAIRAFAEHMEACADLFRATDPEKSCWTYDNTDHARFWFRRAAIETTLHRMDVAEALGLQKTTISDDRAIDAIEDAIDFALPLAARMTGGPPQASLAIRIDGHSDELVLGEAAPTAWIAGDGAAVLLALWGRNHDGVEISGERQVAKQWMTVVGAAFDGR
ncbi:MAG: maleylpyruvate isomerase family mycothiol-dependent enzyme [Acidimicrobiales bacterium]